MAYLNDVAQLCNLPLFPKQGPFLVKEGAVIGICNSYLTAFGLMKVENNAAVSLLIRFKGVGDSAALAESIRNNEGVLNALGEKKWPSKLNKRLQVGADFLIFHWTYSLKKPSAEKLLNLQLAFCDVLRSVAASADNSCDICHSGKSDEIMLYNGMPGHYCASCQSSAMSEQEEAAQKYDALETNLAGGLLMGAIACVAGAIAWGGVAFAINRIFLWGAILIGYMIAWAVFKGIGKINLPGQVMVFVYTVVSILCGDILFYSLSVSKSESIPFTFGLVAKIAANIVTIETAESNGVVSLIFGLVGAGWAVYYKGRRPKFVAKFERLDSGIAAR